MRTKTPQTRGSRDSGTHPVAVASATFFTPAPKPCFAPRRMHCPSIPFREQGSTVRHWCRNVHVPMAKRRKTRCSVKERIGKRMTTYSADQVASRIRVLGFPQARTSAHHQRITTSRRPAMAKRDGSTIRRLTYDQRPYIFCRFSFPTAGL